MVLEPIEKGDDVTEVDPDTATWTGTTKQAFHSRSGKKPMFEKRKSKLHRAVVRVRVS